MYVWDAAKGTHRPGDVSDISPQCEIVPIITVSNLHFKTGGKNSVVSVGLTLHARRLLVYPKQTKTAQMPSMLRNMTFVKRPPVETDNTDCKRVRLEEDDGEEGEEFY